ncbi:uncharacterized protein BX664DRAFT_328339 [Halteromyces radiatus]|uniref:uncharacterized protein n=1 Tax=Halteromyces radiatus TaxID=101107 RepID=UPI0022203725|nr:uncharacterized protein BX664DRAFT_328339 [Halteromyces radiatus]KAI8092863.1 hypothetical protein BX664DRAFT_328339 [Halteromyces radiatus]
MSLETDQIQLSIQLQPEFGWAIKDEPVFGPGSVIQGKVQMEIKDPSLLSKADRLRVVFHGSERSRNRDTLSTQRRVQFFGVQRTLWEIKDFDLAIGQKYAFPFTLQLPMIQFPPSIRDDIYVCYFMLTVYLDQAPHDDDGDILLATIGKEVTLMPFLETCLFKTPLVQHIACNNGDNVIVSTHALDYVANDTILIDVTVPTHLVYSAIHMELHQTIRSMDQTTRRVICSLKQQQEQQSSSTAAIINNTRIQLALPIPCDTIPSFTYSDMASINYKLIIRFHGKKTILSSLLPSSNTKDNLHLELPIKIGTLGYGIRASEELQVYATYRTPFDDSSDTRPCLPLPTFMRNVEYEESLPVYEDTRLPSYDSLYIYDDNGGTSVF